MLVVRMMGLMMVLVLMNVLMLRQRRLPRRTRRQLLAGGCVRHLGRDLRHLARRNHLDRVAERVRPTPLESLLEAEGTLVGPTQLGLDHLVLLFLQNLRIFFFKGKFRFSIEEHSFSRAELSVPKMKGKRSTSCKVSRILWAWVCLALKLPPHLPQAK